MVKCFRPTSMQADPALSRAGSLPQGIWGVCEVRERLGKTVGASLLAKTTAHSTLMQADTPLSRAGSLPQGIWGVCEVRERLGKTVGASLLAMTAAHSTPMQAALTRWAGVSYCRHLEKTPTTSWETARSASFKFARPGYVALRLCLQLRQNPPACPPWIQLVLLIPSLPISDRV
jgi:hypothetical protein